MAQEKKVATREVAPDSLRKGQLLIRYDKSFEARIIQGEDELRSYYDQLKGELLSYKGVKSRISWKHESFRVGKVVVALLKIRGKHISIYLPLNAADYADTKYKVDDVSNVKANAETPCAYAIKNDRRALYAKDLIATVMEAQQCAKLDVAPVSYSAEYPFDSTENLIKRQLIKLVYSKIGARGKEEVLKEVSQEEIEALMAEEPAEVVEEPAEEPVEEPVEEVVEEPAPEPVKEPVKEVVKEKPAPQKPIEKKPAPVKVVVVDASKLAPKCGIINVDTLSLRFNAGEVVTLDEIKKRVPNFDRKVTCLKVLANGSIDKALTVQADDFSGEAVAKIVAAGGSAVRIQKK